MPQPCPACGASVDAAEPAARLRCAACATEWSPVRRVRAVSTRVTRVVRQRPPRSPAQPETTAPPAAPPSRATRKTPVLDARAAEPAGPAALLSGLVEPALIERFAPLSLLDDSPADRLLLALDQRTKRMVALRLGKPTGDGLARRCAHEADLLRRVNHLNVVALVGHGSAGGTPWIAYQYLEGVPLRRRLDSGPLPAREAALIVAQVCDGLAALHRAGWVHRELSPDRVRESGTGLYKLLGFARALPPPGRAPVDWRSAADPRYVAPEQAQGDRPGAGADVYAAGAVLYELLTGGPPFLTSDPNLLAVKHAFDPVVPPGQRVGAAAAFDDVVLRALAKDPGERWASAAELADALRALAG